MDYIEDFLDHVEKWKGAYLSASHSYVCAKIKGIPCPLGARIVLETSKLQQGESFRFETENYSAGRFVKTIKPEQTSELVKKAIEGTFETIEGQATLVKENDSSRSYLNLEEYPLISRLSISGVSLHHLLHNSGLPRNHNWEIRTADTPFNSLDDLLSYCDLPGTNHNRDTTIEVLASSPGEITDNSKILESRGRIECRVAKALRDDKIKLGYFHKSNRGVVKRDSILGSALRWVESADFKVAEHQVADVHAPVFQAFLSYDGVPLHHLSISDPYKHLNARLGVHRAVDPNLELLREALFRPNKNNKSEIFEGAVSVLLGLLGFSVTNYGVMDGFRDGPDVIAYTRSDAVAVVECTIDILTHKDKLSKLVQRTKLVKDELAKAGYSHLQVRPVIVTFLTKDEVKADLPSAGKLGIAVITKENLETAFTQIESPHDAERFLTNLKSFVPGAGSPWDFLLEPQY